MALYINLHTYYKLGLLLSLINIILLIYIQNKMSERGSQDSILQRIADLIYKVNDRPKIVEKYKMEQEPIIQQPQLNKQTMIKKQQPQQVLNTMKTRKKIQANTDKIDQMFKRYKQSKNKNQEQRQKKIIKEIQTLKSFKVQNKISKQIIQKSKSKSPIKTQPNIIQPQQNYQKTENPMSNTMKKTIYNQFSKRLKQHQQQRRIEQSLNKINHMKQKYKDLKQKPQISKKSKQLVSNKKLSKDFLTRMYLYQIQKNKNQQKIKIEVLRQQQQNLTRSHSIKAGISINKSPTKKNFIIKNDYIKEQKPLQKSLSFYTPKKYVSKKSKNDHMNSTTNYKINQPTQNNLSQLKQQLKQVLKTQLKNQLIKKEIMLKELVNHNRLVQNQAKYKNIKHQ